MLIQATIQQIADSHSEALRDRLIDRLLPKKIILFGRYARGKAHNHGNLDLLVNHQK